MDMMKTLLTIIIFAMAAACSSCSKAETLDQVPDTPGETPSGKPEEPDETVSSLEYSDLLDEMTSFDSMTRYPETVYEARQESSYDRRSVDPSMPEWFANDDGWGYIRYEYPEGRVEKVIFDEQHPGVITRMWLTSFGSPETVIRFYFDGAEEPSWVMDSFNLKEFGKYADISLGDALAQPSSAWIRGSSMYLPVTFAKSCKITIEELVDPTTVSRYYHINWRRYPDDFEIPTLTPELLKANMSRIRKAERLLADPQPVTGNTVTDSATLEPGESMSVSLPDGSMSLNQLTVKASVDDFGVLASALEEVIAEGIFDGHKTVSLPLVQLAGCGRGAYYVKSWRFESDAKGTLTVRWMMPYQSEGKILLHNTSGYRISLETEAVTGTYGWDSRSMYFHAAYKKEEKYPVRLWSDYANGIEWNFATITGGRGVYVGDVYTIFNDTYEWPGEGDEKIWVDDESFPSHFGTGVEDYFSFCGYFRYHTPFSGEPRLDAANFHGYNIHYRTRNLDQIPFSAKLRFMLEMEGHAAGTADLENAVFWYGDAMTQAEGVEKYDL